jgi:hypothetical protein
MNRETSKRTLSLDEVHERVREDAQGHWDTTVPRHELLMQDGHLLLPCNGSNGHPDSLRPTVWATAQLCQRLNIPTSYFRRCPSELQDAQANHWLRRGREENGSGTNGEAHGDSEGLANRNRNGHGKGSSPEKWLLRADHAMLRGVLSEHYSPLDNTQLMDSVRPLFNGHYRVEWFGLSDEALHLRVIDPSLTRRRAARRCPECRRAPEQLGSGEARRHGGCLHLPFGVLQWPSRSGAWEVAASAAPHPRFAAAVRGGA